MRLILICKTRSHRKCYNRIDANNILFERKWKKILALVHT
ncbi:hypothetical protein ETTORE_0393 [Pseudomonas phage Ettore]|nr:hypothetical protein ETTORE_0393 [Pseudomonas phage Ettore]